MKRFHTKETSILAATDLKSLRYKILYWVLFGILVLIALCSVIPTIWAVLFGFKGSQEIYAVPTTFFPKQFSLISIYDAWQALQFGPNIISTLIVSLGNVAFTLVICGLGGYVLSRLKPKGAKTIFVIVVWTMMMPSHVRMVPLFMEFIDFPVIHVNMMNSYLPLWLMAAANSFNIMLFKNHFDSVSMALVEAARLDGCNNIRIFSSIMVPLSVPIIAFVAITCINGAWSEFFWPYLVLNDVKLQTLPVRIFLLKSKPQIKMNTYMMGLTFACVPPAVLFAIFQKKIMGGINIGGVKG